MYVSLAFICFPTFTCFSALMCFSHSYVSLNLCVFHIHIFLYIFFFLAFICFPTFTCFPTFICFCAFMCFPHSYVSLHFYVSSHVSIFHELRIYPTFIYLGFFLQGRCNLQLAVQLSSTYVVVWSNTICTHVKFIPVFSAPDSCSCNGIIATRSLFYIHLLYSRKPPSVTASFGKWLYHVQ